MKQPDQNHNARRDWTKDSFAAESTAMLGGKFTWAEVADADATS